MQHLLSLVLQQVNFSRRIMATWWAVIRILGLIYMTIQKTTTHSWKFNKRSNLKWILITTISNQSCSNNKLWLEWTMKWSMMLDEQVTWEYSCIKALMVQLKFKALILTDVKKWVLLKESPLELRALLLFVLLSFFNETSNHFPFLIKEIQYLQYVSSF